MRRAVRVVGLLLLTVPVASGCLAVLAGAAATGGAVGYAYYRGSVTQDVAADFGSVWAATHGACADLGLPVRAPVSDGAARGSLESETGEGTTIRVTVEARPAAIPADGPMTRVSVRVGVLGDRPLSDRLLTQVMARLSQPAQAAPVPGPAPFPQTAPPPLAAPQPAGVAP